MSRTTALALTMASALALAACAPSQNDTPAENGGNETSLDVAMKAAVRQAMAFLTEDVGLAGPVAYAYLSAAADFQCSQVVDRTTGIHALIRKSDL